MIHFLKTTTMKLTKAIFSVLILTLLGTSLRAQSSDPYVNGATVTPAPLPAPGTGGTASVSFLFGNATVTTIPLNALNVVNISLSKLAINGAFSTATNISTSGGDFFVFTYNAVTNTITAQQKAAIPGNSYEIITINGLLVTGASDATSPQNGLNVNVAFLASVNPNQVNDNTSAFTYTGSGGALPLHLIVFNGAKQGNKVLLKWQTSSEQNSSFFMVQTSADGNHWNDIGKVNAAGNSSVNLNYSLLHNTPVNGPNYYRLKEVDKDGNFTYSNIIVINFDIQGLSINSVYPNPFNDNVKVMVNSDAKATVQVELNDNSGRILRTETFQVQSGTNEISLRNLGSLSSGIYTLVVKTPYTTLRFKLRK